MHGRRAFAAAGLSVVVAALLAGCSVIPGLSGTPTGSTAGTAGGSGAGPTFHAYVPGHGMPTATVWPNAGYAAAPFPSMAVPTGVVVTTPSPKQIADPCAARLKENSVASLGVVTSPGSATVSWLNDNAGDITSYKIGTIREDLSAGNQPGPVWQTVAVGTSCAMTSTTISGLVRGGRYTFWLDAVSSTTAPGVSQERMLGRSQSVQIP